MNERWQRRVKQWEPALWLTGLALVALTLQVYGTAWPWLGTVVLAGMAVVIGVTVVVAFRRMNEEDRDISPRWGPAQWILALFLWFLLGGGWLLILFAVGVR